MPFTEVSCGWVGDGYKSGVKRDGLIMAKPFPLLYLCLPTVTFRILKPKPILHRGRKMQLYLHEIWES